MNKEENATNNATILGMTKSKFIFLAAVAALVLVVIILVIVDTTMGGHLYITNDTDKNISNIEITFKNELTGGTVDYLYEGSVASKQKVKYDYDGYYDFSNMYGVCYMKVTFEGGQEMLIYDGEFTSTFNGNFDLKFYQEDGEYLLATKGYEGLFKTTGGSNMNSIIVIDPVNSTWEYEDYDDWDDEVED